MDCTCLEITQALAREEKNILPQVRFHAGSREKFSKLLQLEHELLKLKR